MTTRPSDDIIAVRREKVRYATAEVARLAAELEEAKRYLLESQRLLRELGDHH